MSEQNSAKRKITINSMKGHQSLSISNLSQLKLKEITAQQAQLPKYWTPSQQSELGQYKVQGDIFRSKKVNSLLPSLNSQGNSSTIIHSQQFYNSEFQQNEDDKIITSQLQSHMEEALPPSNKKSFIQQNGSNKNPAETIKLLEKQIKHLKTMNEYYQISLKQKDSIYKTMVLENIKLKHQIQLLEQQNNSKNVQISESNLLFKTQKTLFVDHSHKPFQSLHISNSLQKSSNENNFSSLQTSQVEKQILESQISNQQIENNDKEPKEPKESNIQRRSSKQKLTFIFKPPRVNLEQYSDVPYKIKEDRISKSTTPKNSQESLTQEGVGSKRNSSSNRVNTILDNSIQGYNSNQSKQEQGQSKTNNDEQNNNFLSIKKDKKNSNLDINLRKISESSNLKVDEESQFDQSFLNDTPNASINSKAPFEQFAEETTTISQFQPKKLEIKTNFVSHSTDFAFITQLLDLKSKASDNLRIYNENKSIYQMRQMLNDERILKKTILHLSKNTFGVFFDCLMHTLESSDLFFHLTNKLKNMINAIIKIHLQLEISEAFQMIVKETCSVLECDRASVFLVNAQTQELWTKIAKGSGVIKVPFGQGLVGFVANTMKPLNILDAHKDSRFNPEIDKKNNYHTKSVLCVPVIDSEKGNLVGVMQAINKNDGFFTKDDEGCLQIMAQHAMNVLRNSISHDEKQKNQSMIKNLLNISIRLSKCSTLESIIQKGKNMICQYIDVSDFKLYLYDEPNKKIYTINDQNERLEFDYNCGLIGYSIERKQEEQIDNAYNHTNYNQLVDINTSMPLSIYLIWDNPKKKSQLYGAIQIINANGIHNIGQTTKSLVKFDSHLKLFCEMVGANIKKFQKSQLKNNQNINKDNQNKQQQVSQQNNKIDPKILLNNKESFNQS